MTTEVKFDVNLAQLVNKDAAKRIKALTTELARTTKALEISEAKVAAKTAEIEELREDLENREDEHGEHEEAVEEYLRNIESYIEDCSSYVADMPDYLQTVISSLKHADKLYTALTKLLTKKSSKKQKK